MSFKLYIKYVCGSIISLFVCLFVCVCVCVCVCLAVERWIEGVRGVGITVSYKYDERLFRRYTRNEVRGRLQNAC